MGVLLVLFLLAAAFTVMKYSKFKQREYTYRTTTIVPDISNIKPVSFFYPVKYAPLPRIPLRSEIETNEDFYINPDAVEFRERYGCNVIAFAIDKVNNDIVRWVEVPISNEQMVQLIEGKIKLIDFINQLVWDIFIITDVDLDGGQRSTYKFGYGGYGGSFVHNWDFS